jgi:hypothetical protein
VVTLSLLIRMIVHFPTALAYSLAMIAKLVSSGLSMLGDLSDLIV